VYQSNNFVANKKKLIMGNKQKLLYVDDEVINLELFKIIFKNKYDVLLAKSGSLALKELEFNQDVSVVISDMRMPGLNGIEFVKIAKEKYQNIVYFILTGFEVSSEISQAIENKIINKYFKKPLNAKEIEKSIIEAIDSN
jgi:two-component system, response regulator, stage 0 sporulation protein F